MLPLAHTMLSLAVRAHVLSACARAGSGALLLRPIPEGGAPHPSGFRGRMGEVLDISLRERWVGADGASSTFEWERVGAACIAAAGGAPRVAIDARGLSVPLAVGLAVGAVLRAWRFDALKSRPRRPRRIEWLVDDPEAMARPWAAAEAVLAGVAFARECVAEPGNRLTTTEFTRRLKALQQRPKLLREPP